MSIVVEARRWDGGWEIWMAGEAVTQVTTLDKAAGQVRDYLDTIDPSVDHEGWRVEVRPQIGELSDLVAASRAATVAAVRAQEEAARASRDVARRLREAGLSVTDSAAILGVSRGRVSQLVGSRVGGVSLVS